MKWREIKRDELNFATGERITEMHAMLPIAVLQKDSYRIWLAHKGNWSRMEVDIDENPFFTHYCPLPQLPMEDEE